MFLVSMPNIRTCNTDNTHSHVFEGFLTKQMYLLLI